MLLTFFCSLSRNPGTLRVNKYISTDPLSRRRNKIRFWFYVTASALTAKLNRLYTPLIRSL